MSGLRKFEVSLLHRVELYGDEVLPWVASVRSEDLSTSAGRTPLEAVTECMRKVLEKGMGQPGG